MYILYTSKSQNASILESLPLVSFCHLSRHHRNQLCLGLHTYFMRLDLSPHHSCTNKRPYSFSDIHYILDNKIYLWAYTMLFCISYLLVIPNQIHHEAPHFHFLLHLEQKLVPVWCSKFHQISWEPISHFVKIFLISENVLKPLIAHDNLEELDIIMA